MLYTRYQGRAIITKAGLFYKITLFFKERERERERSDMSLAIQLVGTCERHGDQHTTTGVTCNMHA